jgi:hypothetical protein
VLKYLMLLFGLALSGIVGRASAHHAVATHYDFEAIIEITGTVSDVNYRNPHSFFTLDVVNGGQVEQWEIETHSVPLLRRLGISEDRLSVGDTLTVRGPSPRRAGARALFGGQLIFPDGAEFMLTESLRSRLIEGIAAERIGEPDDAPILERLAGRWSSITGAFGATGGSPMPLNESGLAARAAYDPVDTPAQQCIPPNLPSLLYQPYLYEIRTGPEGLVLYHEYANISRALVFGVEAVSTTPPEFGERRARIEGEALIVESRAIPAHGAGLASDWDANGRGANIPSSARKEIIERYTLRENGQILVVDYTVTDPVYLERPYSARVEWQRVRDDAPMYEFECDLDSATRSRATLD